ncbi:YpdA family putative bacillithiol disulfide reductase [Olivibacter sitiensis]|uniref:YpdA family putative bacillithiol disulfide reductase n=1 Tax=Olivibacter sitiensis TaxID=376470 RepID=UPI0003FCF279|nr:YpdA family putative bacillithiol disulfide reductase [Olivibacter sitiensis]
METFDILIIGGGPIGLACGIAAKQAGLSHIILEKGCLVNSLYNYPVNMTFFSTSEKLEIGETPFVTTNPKPKRAEALEYYRRVQDKFSLNVRLFEEVLNVEKKEDGQFITKSSKSEYRSRFVIVATGFYDKPNLMNIEGEELSKVRHYYDDPHYYAYQKVVVIGSSNSSVDAALETFRKGAEVTMVIRRDTIGERVKYWVRPDIENRIAEGSIKAYFNSCLLAIRPNEVDIQTPEGRVETIANDFVLALTGYQPDFAFLEKIGIQLSSDDSLIPAHNTDTMETNISGLYLAGVVCGGMNTHLWFIENSRIHADIIMKHIKIKGFATA